MIKIRPLSKELAEKARKELNETSERMEQDVQVLKTWLTKTPYIKARIDDQLLVNVLRGCKYSLERAKEKIDCYYTVRTVFKDLFENRYDYLSKTDSLVPLGFFVPLPNTEGPDGPRITLCRYGVYDPNVYDPKDLMKVAYMMLDVMEEEDDNLNIAGLLCIVDCSGFTFNHMKKLDLVFFKKFTMSFQDASWLRYRGLIFVNAPPAFATLYNLIKGFFSEKVKSKIAFLGDDPEALYRLVPLELLPEEYGGKCGKISDLTSIWAKKLQSYSKLFKDELQYGTIEKLRPGRPKNEQTLFGLEGSFKKLEVD